METFRKIVIVLGLTLAAIALFVLVTNRKKKNLVALTIGDTLHVVDAVEKKDGYGSYKNDGL